MVEASWDAYGVDSPAPPPSNTHKLLETLTIRSFMLHIPQTSPPSLHTQNPKTVQL